MRRRTVAVTLSRVAMGASLAGCWLVAGLQDRPLSRDGEAGSPEASGDTGGEVIPSSDAKANSACANTFASKNFCDDFDNNGFQPNWELETAGAGASISIVSSPHVSMPYALRASTSLTVPDGGPPAAKLLRVARNVPSATTYTLEADVQNFAFADGPAGLSPQSIGLTLSSTLANGVLLFVIRSHEPTAACRITQAVLSANGGATEQSMPFAYGRYHHVILKATKNADSTITYTCDVDGVTRFATTPSALAIDANIVSSIGVLAQPNQRPVTFLYDNVVFDAR